MSARLDAVPGTPVVRLELAVEIVDVEKVKEAIVEMNPHHAGGRDSRAEEGEVTLVSEGSSSVTIIKIILKFTILRQQAKKI